MKHFYWAPAVYNSCLALIVTVVCATACKKNVSDAPAIGSEYEAIIASAGTAPTEAVAKKEELNVSVEDKMIDGVKATVTKKRVKAWAIGGGENGYPLFNPNAGVIYPGSLLQGASLGNATPDVIACKRAGGVISIDLANGSIGVKVAVPEVSKSAITQAINDILANNTGIVPAHFTISYENVQSKEQLALELNANFNSTWSAVEANLSLSGEKEYNRYLVKLQQVYYTISFDLPVDYAGIFHESVTPQDLKKYVGPGNPATYISDVTFGRVYYMLIESTSRRDHLEAAVKASFNGIVASGGGEVQVEHMKDMKDLKIKLMALGGDAATTIRTLGVTEIKELADMFAGSTDIKTGMPLSYVVRNVADNKIVKTQLNNEYDVVDVVFHDNMFGFPIYHLDATSAVTKSYLGIEGVAEWKNTFNNALHLHPYDHAHYVDQIQAAGHDVSSVFQHAGAGKRITNATPAGKPAIAFTGITFTDIANPEQSLLANYLKLDGTQLENRDYTIFLVVRSNYAGEGDWKYMLFSTDRKNDGFGNRSPFIALTGNSIITGHDLIKKSTKATTSIPYVEAQVSSTDTWNVYAIRFSQQEGTSIYVNNNPPVTVASVNRPIGQFTAGALGYKSSNTVAVEGVPALDAHFDIQKAFNKIELAEFVVYGAAGAQDVIAKEIRALREKYQLN